MNVVELPLDVLLVIARHLSARDLLNLCSTSKALYQDEELRFSAQYWSRLTKSTFRVPVQALVASDGKRWMKLYRRLRTQSAVYCWGNDDRGSTGNFRAPSPSAGPSAELTRPSRGWPRRTLDDVGLVADLQCGGWCTAVLNQKGEIWLNGIINGERLGRPLPPPPRQLLFPEMDHKSDTAIAQFSVGRKHILGLSDSGLVWSWSDVAEPGILMSLLSMQSSGPEPDRNLSESFKIAMVKAGWSRASAYAVAKGIVVWDPVDAARARKRGATCETTPESMEWVVPGTSNAGSVTNWIVLAGYVLFVTNAGRAYACHFPENEVDPQVPFELTTKTHGAVEPTRPAVADDFISDVQGSHTSFALLYLSGQVLTSSQSYLDALYSRETTTEAVTSVQIPLLRRIPALQHTSVIQLAFGDYHFHALHADGSITSYGTESHYCGSFGLGHDGTQFFRGVRGANIHTRDIDLHPECLTTGRRIVFEDEKRWWIDWVGNAQKDPQEAMSRLDIVFTREVEQVRVSEWFEQQLRNWKTVVVKEEDDDDGLPAYFALNIAAAGWHSGALVLVNAEKARRNREFHRMRVKAERDTNETREGELGSATEEQSLWQRFRERLNLRAITVRERIIPPQERPTLWTWEDETFPRLRMSNGEPMPGDVPIVEWDCPEWKEVEEVEI